MKPLAPEFLTAPLAHRGYHDAAAGRPENSLAAFEAAITAGYGIELDVQLSSDGHAKVFHDYHLDRLTDETGSVNVRTMAELRQIKLKNSNETIPTLTQVLGRVAGRAPLLIEIKDQDGVMGANVGPLEKAVADALADYSGPVAVMSFNPHAVREFTKLSPKTACGLTTSSFPAESWPLLPAKTRAHLRLIEDYEPLGASFISHHASDLENARVQELKSAGAAILCWTVRSPQAEKTARNVADNITFEGYAPHLPPKKT
ncbi:MAG: phosphodiesterase [Marinosulfonomonas sp.]|nr:phosphodiesterase [Marinosulfonomonas sp.]